MGGTAAHDQAPDAPLRAIVEYVCHAEVGAPAALHAARICMVDALACAFLALDNRDCAHLLGPLVPGATLAGGARVPGTGFELDPATAAFNIGCLVRWLDMNDTFTGAAAIHPSDCLAGILAVADYLARQPGARRITLREVLEALVKAYEIQGSIALLNDSFGNAGHIDHVTLTKVAEAAVIARLLGGDEAIVLNALSNAWLEPLLRLYRHSHQAGSRKNWAAADASAQAVRLAYVALKGEMGYPQVLSSKKHGFCDAMLGGKALQLREPLGSYVIENVMLKAVPSAMYGQSGAECAFLFHAQLQGRWDEVERIIVHVHAGVKRIMDREGPLRNAADRDHCMQYVIAVSLIHGRLQPEDFADEFAADPLIDAVRAKMVLVEDPRFTADFADPARRSSAIGIEVCLRDGSTLARRDVEYPSGHPRRRAETAGVYERKFSDALARRFPPERVARIAPICADQARFEATPVAEFMGLLAG